MPDRNDEDFTRHIPEDFEWGKNKSGNAVDVSDEELDDMGFTPSQRSREETKQQDEETNV